jgi:RelA/SpoT family (p)ppGpp synthetase
LFQFTDLRDELALYLSQEQVAQITAAFFLAEKAHEGQTRRSGEPYITHPIEVARILASMRMDYESIMAAMLHDVLEDTSVDKVTLTEKFGDSVADLVDGVSKLTHLEFASRAEAQAENFRKMILAMVRDIRVILVKLADRLHNMRTLDSMPPKKRRRIAKETLEIYAPIANRLGMNSFRLEFEDLGFKALYPMRYRILKNAIRKARGNRKEVMVKIEQRLQNALKESGLFVKAAYGREKHLYSIYKKMRDKRVAFSEIMDVYAFRIIVESVDDCYRALGIVHNLFKPVPGRFKDYIAIPKQNSYQSLHTVLFGPYGVPIEIQIRTEEMHRLAEKGIAAHWMYKSSEKSVTEAHSHASAWMQNLLEMQDRSGNSLEFIENVKIDLFPDEVYVFTPKGNIMELPAGACAVDFAYAVHTDIGNSCVAAKIDRQLAPLSTPLLNGQTVEIISLEGARPNPAWLNFVVTGKARGSIRHFLKTQHHTEAVELGRKMLVVALTSLSLQLETIPAVALGKWVVDAHAESEDDLFAEIGLGHRVAILEARRLAKLIGVPENQVNEEKVKSVPLSIQGTEGMVINFAKCCWPIPGDHIIGELTSGHGLTIHQEHCNRIMPYRSNREKYIPVRWSQGVTGEFQVELRIEVINQRGILALLAVAISDAEANIDHVRSEDRDGSYSVISMILSVRDRKHLARIIRRIRVIKAVNRITRPKPV